jgi:hypothetical protein
MKGKIICDLHACCNTCYYDPDPAGACVSSLGVVFARRQLATVEPHGVCEPGKNEPIEDQVTEHLDHVAT